MKKLFVIFLVAVLFMAGCAAPMRASPLAEAPVKPSGASGTATPPGAEGLRGTVKIGAMLPLTGTLANTGKGMQNAMLLAIEDINSNGGINGKKAELVVEDTACDKEKAVAAANKLITVDKILALAGPSCSDESIATAQILNDNRIIAISPSATSPNLTARGGDYWFRVVPSDVFQGKAAAQYAATKMGKKRVSIVYINNDWGTSLKDQFTKYFLLNNGEIAVSESFEPGTSDIKTQVTTARALNSDLIYLLCYPQECAAALRQFSQLLPERAVLLGADEADDPETLAVISPAAEGFTITSPIGGSADFSLEYKNKYKKDPGAYAAQSYDAVRLIAEAANKGGEDGAKMKDYLYKASYKGVSGSISFDANGDLTTANYDIKKFSNGRFVLVEQVAPG
jgi:branched-chain amino acid transport system substrate-binding protein